LALKNAAAGRMNSRHLLAHTKKKLKDSYTSSIRPHATGVLGLKVLVYEVQMSRHLFAHVPVHKEQDSKHQPAKRLQKHFPVLRQIFFFGCENRYSTGCGRKKKIEPSWRLNRVLIESGTVTQQPVRQGFLAQREQERQQGRKGK
jgi:hypothetical protein